METEYSRRTEPQERSSSTLIRHLVASLQSIGSGAPSAGLSGVHDRGNAASPGSWAGADEPSARAAQDSSGTDTRARKVSVSIPDDLIDAVRKRVGRGGFSRYVTEAVAKQLELDLSAELSALLEEQYGPVSEEALAEAEAMWPDAD
ncbi:hypothetical protein GCM10027570_54280 [Streptomonospora sediminis]